MASILYIECSPRKNRSSSIKVASAFIEAYKKTHPKDSVKTLRLFEMELPAFDGFTIQAKYTIMHGGHPADEEKQAWSRVEAVINEFKSADKYLFSVPMWNFGIPYKLKHYIDVLVQPGYTFRVGDKGYEGLVTGKPVLAVYARGGQYGESSPAAAMDMQKRYLEQIFRFIGFTDIRSILVESTLGGRQSEESSVQEGIRLAGQMAADF
jgi:FMN-dependent NADH-azoreductase